MKSICLVIVLFSAVMIDAGAVLVYAQQPTVTSQKKGVGLSGKSEFGEKQLEGLKVFWYYNWNTKSNIPSHAQFVPMFWSMKRLNEQIDGDYVLGYNEPDNKEQSNITVEKALEGWLILASKAKFIGSPGVSGNPVTGDWFPHFMAANPKVDFVTIHWYKGADPQHFIRDINEVYAKYGKPIWVTEFAPQTINSSEHNPNKYSQEQVNKFISETIRWMENTPWVERYAWHDSRVGTSALFDENGELTATGKTYADSGCTAKNRK